MGRLMQQQNPLLNLSVSTPLQDHLLEVLRPGLAERSYADGEHLLRQGEHGTQLLYIVEGTVDVLLKLAPAREQLPVTNPDPDPSKSPSSGLAPTGCVSARAASSGAHNRGCAEDSGGGRDGSAGAAAVPEVVGDELPPALLEVSFSTDRQALCVYQLSDPAHSSVSRSRTRAC